MIAIAGGILLAIFALAVLTGIAAESEGLAGALVLVLVLVAVGHWL